MTVTRAEKSAELSALEGAFGGAESAILIDYRGLKVSEATELRRQIRAAGASYLVVKNTLAKRVLAGTPFEPLTPFFKGMTGVAFSPRDPVALAKTVVTFAKTAEALKVKAAVVQGREVTPQGVAELATLPGRAELYARLLSVLQAPMVQIVTVLSATPRSLVNALAQYERKQAGS